MKTTIISGCALVVGLLVGIAVTRWQTAHPTTAATPTAPLTLAPLTFPAPGAQPSDRWDPFTEMRQMQANMDRMFHQSIDRFRNDPFLKGFDETPGYSLSLDVRDLKDHYEVHATLPDAKAADVNVKLEDKTTLQVEVSNKASKETRSGHNSSATTEWGQYAQTIQLPSPVQVDKMKVDRKDHDLVITLPKA